ncbi:MAG: hypothetical protein IAF38_10915 [Bacteroidia bacterium]|nr:hypothetical protein [Bacteroidia bacterium]
MKARWIYFDIPYSESADKMRGLLGFEDEKKISVINSDGCRDIPETILKLENLAVEKGVLIDTSIVLVYPHDDRHGLAWPVKEQSEKKGWQFSRQIPADFYPPAEDLILYSSFDDGSQEMHFDISGAQQKIMNLNAAARDEFSEGDMLPVMGKLRHALRVSVRNLGWASPLTVYTLRNLLTAFNATGNYENQNEGIFLIKQLIHAFTDSPPTAEAWSDSMNLIEELAVLLEGTGNPELAIVVRSLTVFII